MKNSFWKLSLRFLVIAFASLALAALALIAVIYATYKIFDLEVLREAVRMTYRIFDHSLRNTTMEDYQILGNQMRMYPWYLAVPPLLMLATFFNYLLTRRTTQRMDALANAVEQMQDGQYRVHLPNDNTDALGHLERTINALAIQIDETFQQRREIEQSKDDFIVNIAHDLRTPITSVSGYLSFISEKDLDAELSAKYAGVALRKARQLEGLIEALFEIAHLSNDEIAIEKSELDLRRLLLQKQDELYPQLQDADMQLRLNLKDGPDRVYADGALMARVFDNLIHNAIRYAQEGRYIDIVTRSLDEHRVCISLYTHANPIPKDELERIFDKSYRLEKSRSTESGGTGLGLSISRRIVELHGGVLQARQAGDGTAFDIYLPTSTEVKLKLIKR